MGFANGMVFVCVLRLSMCGALDTVAVPVAPDGTSLVLISLQCQSLPAASCRDRRSDSSSQLLGACCMTQSHLHIHLCLIARVVPGGEVGFTIRNHQFRTPQCSCALRVLALV